MGVVFGAALSLAAGCESSGKDGVPVIGGRGGLPGMVAGATGAGAGESGGGAAAESGGRASGAGTTSAPSTGGSSTDDAGAGGEPASGGSAAEAGGSAGSDLVGASGEAGAASGRGGSDGSGLGGRGTAGSSAGSPATGGSTGGQGTAGGGGTAGAGSGGRAGTSGGTTGAIEYVFVITMENHDPAEIIGNDEDAPYINGALLPYYAQSSNFRDQFSRSVPSEPHYIWMEAGTNVFSDHTFSSNDSPSASNSTSDTNHLVTQLADAGVSWMSYQEGIDSTSGACPIASSGHYHPRHNPFVFFQDIAGDPPSKTNAYCAAHHKSFVHLVDDISAGAFARYNFITPDQCNDMHGHTGCPSSNLVRMGDDWLAAHLPGLIDFVTDNAGVIFIVWDEGDATTSMPFIVVGPGVKEGYAGSVEYNHGSLVKSLQLIFDVDVTSRVSAEDDFSDLFEPGMFP